MISKFLVVAGIVLVFSPLVSGFSTEASDEMTENSVAEFSSVMKDTDNFDLYFGKSTDDEFLGAGYPQYDRFPQQPMNRGYPRQRGFGDSGMGRGFGDSRMSGRVGSPGMGRGFGDPRRGGKHMKGPMYGGAGGQLGRPGFRPMPSAPGIRGPAPFYPPQGFRGPSPMGPPAVPRPAALPPQFPGSDRMTPSGPIPGFRGIAPVEYSGSRTISSAAAQTPAPVRQVESQDPAAASSVESKSPATTTVSQVQDETSRGPASFFSDSIGSSFKMDHALRMQVLKFGSIGAACGAGTVALVVAAVQYRRNRRAVVAKSAGAYVSV